MTEKQVGWQSTAVLYLLTVIFHENAVQILLKVPQKQFAAFAGQNTDDVFAVPASP